MRLSHLAAISALCLAVASPALAQTAGTSTTAKPSSSAMPPASHPTKMAPASTGATAPSSTLIDINTAPKDQLDKLPQIGSARADAIIKGRPYKAKDELVERKIIPQNAYDAIKGKIIARQKS